MIKQNGKELPISLMKLYLPDITIDQLEEVRDYLQMENNIVALIHMIDGYHGLMNQWKKSLEEQKEQVESTETTLEELTNDVQKKII